MTSSENICDRIAAYLRKKGRMSGNDICDDLGLETWDVEWAVADSACPVERCAPSPGGDSPWFHHYDGKKPEETHEQTTSTNL